MATDTAKLTFTATSDAESMTIPYWEDARSNYAPYYDIRNRTLEDAKNEVAAELGKLGGGIVGWIEGYWGSGTKKRYGYKLRYIYGGAIGEMVVAGLPMQGQQTDRKVFQVRLQALLILRDWLKNTVTSRVFTPGSDVLIASLLVSGEMTLAEYIKRNGNMPRINPPPDTPLLTD